MELYDGFDSIAKLRCSPNGLGQAPRMKVGIDGDVVTEALLGTEQRLQLDLLHMPFDPRAALDPCNGFKNLVVVEHVEGSRDLRLLLQDRELRRAVDDREILPVLGHDAVDRRTPVRKRQDADDLGKVGVGGRPN